MRSARAKPSATTRNSQRRRSRFFLPPCGGPTDDARLEEELLDEELLLEEELIFVAKTVGRYRYSMLNVIGSIQNCDRESGRLHALSTKANRVLPFGNISMT